MAYFGLLVYTSLIYIRPQEIFMGIYGFPIIDIVAIITIFLTVITNKPNINRFLASPQNKLMLLFLMALVISHLSHTYMRGALNAFTEFSKIVIFYFLITTLVDTPKKLKVYIIVLIFLTLFLAIQGIQQYHTGIGWGGKTPIIQKIEVIREDKFTESGVIGQVQEVVRIRGLGIFSDPNDLALSFVMVVPFLMTAIFAKNGFTSKVVSISILSIILYAIYITNSRGGYLALAVVIYNFFIGKFGGMKGMITGALSILLLLSYAPSRIGTIMEGSTYGRMEAWSYSLQLFKSAPLFGIGMNMFTNDFPLTVHNSFLLILAEAGLLGAFLWVGLFYLCFRDLLKVKKVSINRENSDLKVIAFSLLLGIIGFLSASFFLSRTYIHLPYIMIALTVSLTSLIRENNKNLKTGFGFKDFKWIFFIIISLIVFVYLGLRFLWSVK